MHTIGAVDLRTIILAGIIAAALPIVGGCSGRAEVAAPPEPTAAQPEWPADPGVLAALAADPACRCLLGAAATTHESLVVGGELRFRLRDGVLPIRVGIARDEIRLVGTVLSMVMEEGSGPTRVRTLRVHGSPARVLDASGATLVFAGVIILGLDDHGVTTVDIEGGGAIAAIPGA